MCIILIFGTYRSFAYKGLSIIPLGKYFNRKQWTVQVIVRKNNGIQVHIQIDTADDSQFSETYLKSCQGSDKQKHKSAVQKAVI